MLTHIFLQARFNSQRLPGKILKKICGKTILELILERVQKVKLVDKIVLVTGDVKKNKLLIEEAKRLNIEIFVGSEENILDRLYEASEKFNSEYIIRITGDNPLIDYALINLGMDYFLKNNYDLLIMDKKTFPLGLNFEIIKKSVLDANWKEQYNSFLDKIKFNDCFIPLNYNTDVNKKFKKYNFSYSKDLSNTRLTLDYEEDFLFISKIFNTLYSMNPLFNLNDILDFLKIKNNFD